MIPGYTFCKTGNFKAEHLSSVSYYLIYLLGPCMIINSFLNMPLTKDNLLNMSLFFVFSFLMQFLFFLILFLIFRKKQENPLYRLLTVGGVLGNVGFFGLPLIQSLFPDHPEVACYSSVYAVSMNLLVFTIGIYCVTGEKKYISLKNAFINPTTTALLIALPLYLTKGGEWMPDFLRTGIEILARMTTPVCMLILGARLAMNPIKKLFTIPQVYLTCALKMLVFPLFCYGLALLFPLPHTFRVSVLILSGTPCASILLALAEIHNKGEDLAANSILLSTLLSILTLPLLALLIR